MEGVARVSDARHMQKSVTKPLPPLLHQIALFQRRSRVKPAIAAPWQN